MLASELQLTRLPENPTAVFPYLTLIAAPAFAFATWQTRKPPPQRGPPD
jgi:hypothetical protein